MFNRSALLLVAGAAIFALDASASSAQSARPRSQKRIPITKEAPGEVVAPRVDTVTIYRTDTLTTPGRVDTVTTTNTVTRVDTVVQTVNLTPRMYGGFYFGLAGGMNLPYGGIRTVNEPAGTGQLQLGWQGLHSPIGIRGDAQYSQFSENATYAELGAKPDVWNGNLDLKLQIPILNHLFGSAVSFSPYLIGGGSWIHYRNLRMLTDESTTVGVNGLPNSAVMIGGGDNGYHSDWGWNAGGGLAWHMGKKEVFVESRVISFKRGAGDNGQPAFETARQIPIVFGVNFF